MPNPVSRFVRLAAAVCGLVGLSPSTLPAQTQVFTVGAAGSHPTIQAALDAAAVASGSREIRIARGRYAESLDLRFLDSGSIGLSGGWSADFTRRSGNARLTVIDASGLGRALQMSCENDGRLSVHSLTLQGGDPSVDPTNLPPGVRATRGGGLHYRSDSIGCRLELDRLVVRRNLGGGGFLFLQDSSAVIRRSLFDSNATGHGLAIEENGFGSSAHLDRVRSTRNDHGGLSLSGYYLSTLITDSLVANNRALGTRGGGLDLAGGDNHLDVQRTQLRNNEGPQVFLQIADSTHVRIESSLVAGADEALRLLEDGVSNTYTLTNVTMVGGVELEPDPLWNSGSVYNSILMGDVRLSSAVDADFNLINGAPRFVAPQRGDYRLRASSPAINAGTNSPPLGLGVRDLANARRVIGSLVDLGAYERKRERSRGRGRQP